MKSAQNYVELCSSDKLSSRLYIQKQKRRFCDVDLILCDERFAVHSCVIGSSSSYVEKLLASNDNKVMLPKYDLLVDFNAEEKELFCRECAEKVVDFMYCCNIQVDVSHIPHIYELGKKLEIADLETLCKPYFTSDSPIHIPSTTVLCIESSNEANSDTVFPNTNVKATGNDVEVNRSSGKCCVEPGWSSVDAASLSCPKCKDSFSNVMMLQQHCNTHFGKLYNCFVCNYSTLKVPHLLKHVKDANHMETVCSLCLHESESNCKLQEHMNEHEHAQPFFCRTCKNRFQTRTALNSHIVKHSTETPFICTVCGRGFKWKQGLQNHMFIHTSTKNHLCDECGYSTAHLKSFQDHKTIHSGKKFKCPISACEFSSARKESVKHHLSTHSKEKSYQCEVCGRAFSQAKNLRRHAAIHDPGAQPAHCPFCSFTTMRSDKFRDHLRSCYKRKNQKTDPPLKNKRPADKAKTVEILEPNTEQTVSFASNSSTEAGITDSLFDINQIMITTSVGDDVSLAQDHVNIVVCNVDGSLAMDFKCTSSENEDVVDVNTDRVAFHNSDLLQGGVGSQVEIGSLESYVSLDPLLHKTMNSMTVSPQVSSSHYRMCLPLTNLGTGAVLTSKSQSDSLLNAFLTST